MSDADCLNCDEPLDEEAKVHGQCTNCGYRMWPLRLTRKARDVRRVSLASKYATPELMATAGRERQALDECDALEDRVDDAYRMGERLRALVEAMRAANDENTKAFCDPYDATLIDDLAQIGTVLLGVKS